FPEIPFKLYQGYVIVMDGRICTLEHQNLLLDTGTNPSMIDRSIAARLGLHGAPGGLELFNKKVVSESVTLSDFQVGPLRRQNVRVMVADFSKIGKGLGVRIDAVIGLDLLGGRSFTVDYTKHRFLFGASPEPHTAPLIANQQFIAVNLSTGGRQLRLLLDTGTPQLVLFQSHLRDLDYVFTGTTGSGQNISGNVAYGNVILPQASIGTQDVGPRRASIVASQQDVESDFDGLLGISSLRPKRISFDFEKQVMGWSD
ncbi:MAG TPA: pepsin/retropepsin-like aspartic protease family protein, partial [Candidatus Sulfotelmatobacter sp.]